MRIGQRLGQLGVALRILFAGREDRLADTNWAVIVPMFCTNLLLAGRIHGIANGITNSLYYLDRILDNRQA